MRIIEDTKLDFSDVLIVPKRSSLVSRKEVTLERDHYTLHSQNILSGIPIISSNMDHTGTFEMAEALDNFNVSTAIHKHYGMPELVTFFSILNKVPTYYTMGTSQHDYETFNKINDLTTGNLRHVCIDVANGYSEPFAEFVSRMREKNPNITIMAGNVVTPEMTEQLIISGADIVKVGIGNGSVCTTRKLTGVGYPQLSAVMECSDAAHGLKGHVCCDGGCQMPGDVAKAFGAGADFVMIGGMFAGHEECGGEMIYEDGPAGSSYYSEEEATLHNSRFYYNTVTNSIYQLDDNDITWSKLDIDIEPIYMKFYGMSSTAAMEKYSGGVAEYRASEGKEVLIPYRGTIETTIKEILGGLRSACTYTGSKTLKELPKRTTFIKVHHTHNTLFGDEK